MTKKFLFLMGALGSSFFAEAGWSAETPGNLMTIVTQGSCSHTIGDCDQVLTNLEFQNRRIAEDKCGPQSSETVNVGNTVITKGPMTGGFLYKQSIQVSANYLCKYL